MEKTILRLHANGDLESMVPLIQDKNLYVISDSIPGFIDRQNGGILNKIYGTMTSDFIAIEKGEKYTFQINWNPSPNIDYRWACGYFYDENKAPTSKAFEIDSYKEPFYKTLITTLPNQNASYIRLSATFLDDLNNTSLQFELGGNATEYQRSIKDIKGFILEQNIFSENEILTKPIIKFENDGSMPTWAKETGNPISFFKEGILIKGNLIKP